MSRVAALALLALLFVGTAEAARLRQPVECTKPSGLHAVTYAPVDFELSLAPAAEPATLVVTLNGTDVSGAFTVDSPPTGRKTAKATDVWGGVVLPGANTLQASVVKQGQSYQCTRSFQASGDPYVDAVVSYVVGASGGYPGTNYLPNVVKGPPMGSGLFQGGLDVFSLGFGGQIVLRFDDNAIANGPGADFTVFENAFMAFNGATLTIERPFADPAIVSVSQNGTTWHTFPCQLTTNPPAEIFYPGCAGVYPVLSSGGNPHPSIPTHGTMADLVGAPLIPPPTPGGAGGDSFDLAAVGLSWARYVRIVDANVVTGDPYGPNNAGADVDAVAAIHSVPATDANGNGVPDALEW